MNASFLGKNGAISQLLKILSSCGKKHTNLVKIALESLHLLVKSSELNMRVSKQFGTIQLFEKFNIEVGFYRDGPMWWFNLYIYLCCLSVKV